MPELSAAEQQLVEFARREVGASLTSFLLAGLGEEAGGRRWRFTITAVTAGGGTLDRQVEAFSYEPADGNSYLPRERDPLVLLALLQLLAESGQGLGHTLRYERGDVLKLLGRGDTPEQWHLIDGAVERYSLLTFKWGLSAAELAREHLSHYSTTESLITEVETIDEGETGNGRMKRALNRVVFNPEFVSRLKGRSLFGLNWDEVVSLKLGGD
jgi:hypothetical protein